MTPPSAHGTLPEIADHDGVLVSYALESQRPKNKSRNADSIG